MGEAGVVGTEGQQQKGAVAGVSGEEAGAGPALGTGSRDAGAAGGRALRLAGR